MGRDGRVEGMWIEAVFHFVVAQFIERFRLIVYSALSEIASKVYILML